MFLNNYKRFVMGILANLDEDIFCTSIFMDDVLKKQLNVFLAYKKTFA